MVSRLEVVSRIPRKGTGAEKKGASPQQYVEGEGGAGLPGGVKHAARPVVAANMRLQQKCS